MWLLRGGGCWHTHSQPLYIEPLPRQAPSPFVSQVFASRNLLFFNLFGHWVFTPLLLNLNLGQGAGRPRPLGVRVGSNDQGPESLPFNSRDWENHLTFIRTKDVMKIKLTYRLTACQGNDLCLARIVTVTIINQGHTRVEFF